MELVNEAPNYCNGRGNRKKFPYTVDLCAFCF